MKWRMMTLILIGVCLAISSMLLFQKMNVFYWDLYLFVAISFYPLAIMYGRSVMIDIFQSIKSGPYSPIKAQPKTRKLNLFASCINFMVGILVLMYVGWIYGVYNAYKRYQMERGYIVK